MHVLQFFQTIPPEAIYALVLLIVGIESLGVPLPGEITLMSAAFLSAHSSINPVLVAIAAIIGAITGDSIGYYFGHHYGHKLLNRLSRNFPNHFGPKHIRLAEKLFKKWGAWAVFFGRFIAILRIFAGPLAGILKMKYTHFLAANVSGAIVWASSITAIVYFLGLAAEQWLRKLSWLGLLFVIIVGVLITLIFRSQIDRLIQDVTDEKD